METQQVDAQVSLLSRMNAFYGIPNLSQETAAAVQQGAPAPEVYSPEDNQLLQATEDTNGGTDNPVENFFAATTEQVEISSQAIALQQQDQTTNQPTQTDSAANTALPLDTATPTPASDNNNQPTAMSALNAETPVPPDNNLAATQPVNEYNVQSSQANTPIAASANYSSNAVQPGALFSALG